MPSNWQAIDNNFPSFTGEESPKQQIEMLHNYLFQLREGLKYSLQNLSSDNFSETGLQSLTDEQKKVFAEQLRGIQTTLGQLSATIDRVSGQIGGVTEEWITSFERRVRELEEDTTAADTMKDVSGEGGLKDRMNAAESAINVLEEGYADHEERLQKMEDDDSLAQIRALLTGEDGLQGQVNTLQENMQTIAALIQNADDGATIGKEGVALRLVGNIYINGVPFEKGEST